MYLSDDSLALIARRWTDGRLIDIVTVWPVAACRLLQLDAVLLIGWWVRASGIRRGRMRVVGLRVVIRPLALSPAGPIVGLEAGLATTTSG